MILKDGNGKKIGELVYGEKQIMILKDNNGQKRGSFDPVSNTTRDASGRLVGRGNVLAMLLRK